MFGIKCHTLQICLEDSQQETDLELPMSVQESLVVEWLVVACFGVGITECSSACLGPSEEGHHYLHYLHHSLASAQKTGREHSPALQ